MGLEEGLAEALAEIEDPFVNRIDVQRTEQAARPYVPHVQPQPPHQFIRNEGVADVVLAGAQTEMLELPDRIVGEQRVVERSRAKITGEVEVEGGLLRGIPVPGCQGELVAPLIFIRGREKLLDADAQADVRAQRRLVGGIIARREIVFEPHRALERRPVPSTSL